MFAIYNINGRAFRDNLETLRRVRQPDSVLDTQVQADVAQDETIVIQGSDDQYSLGDQSKVNAYRKMVHANERMVIVHAYQIMTHPVKTLTSNISITEAYEEFEKYGVNQFPVYTPQLQLQGMVTRFQALQAMQQTPSAPLSTIISADVITADPVSDIRRVASVMTDYQLSAVPVVNEDDKLVGIVSKTDIVKALVQDPPLSLWA